VSSVGTRAPPVESPRAVGECLQILEKALADHAFGDLLGIGVVSPVGDQPLVAGDQLSAYLGGAPRFSERCGKKFGRGSPGAVRRPVRPLPKGSLRTSPASIPVALGRAIFGGRIGTNCPGNLGALPWLGSRAHAKLHGSAATIPPAGTGRQLGIGAFAMELEGKVRTYPPTPEEGGPWGRVREVGGEPYFSKALFSFARSLRTAFVWIWQTRDSVMSRILPISFMFSSS
jgi:hypothetical protein